MTKLGTMYPFCFATVINGLVIGHTETSQINIINILVNGHLIPETSDSMDPVYLEERETIFISREASSRYINGIEALGGDRRKRLLARPVEEVTRLLRKEIVIEDANTVVSAFHTFATIKRRINIPIDDLTALESTIEQNDPVKYIATAILRSLSFRKAPKKFVTKDDLEALQFLTVSETFDNVFAQKPAESLAASREVTEEEKALFNRLAKYCVSKTTLLDLEDDPEKLQLYHEDYLLLYPPYSPPGYNERDLADLEEAGLVRRPIELELISDGEDGEVPDEVFMSRKGSLVLAVESRYKKYDRGFPFKACILTKQGLSKLADVAAPDSDDWLLALGRSYKSNFLSPEEYTVSVFSLALAGKKTKDGDDLYKLDFNHDLLENIDIEERRSEELPF